MSTQGWVWGRKSAPSLYAKLYIAIRNFVRGCLDYRGFSGALKGDIERIGTGNRFRLTLGLPFSPYHQRFREILESLPCCHSGLRCSPGSIRWGAPGVELDDNGNEVASSSADPPAVVDEDESAVDQGDDEDGSSLGPVLVIGLVALALLLLVGIYWRRRSGP